jgi:putative peptidoglycan lipid II flippase
VTESRTHRDNQPAGGNPPAGPPPEPPRPEPDGAAPTTQLPQYPVRQPVSPYPAAPRPEDARPGEMFTRPAGDVPYERDTPRRPPPDRQPPRPGEMFSRPAGAPPEDQSYLAADAPATTVPPGQEMPHDLFGGHLPEAPRYGRPGGRPADQDRYERQHGGRYEPGRPGEPDRYAGTGQYGDAGRHGAGDPRDRRAGQPPDGSVPDPGARPYSEMPTTAMPPEPPRRPEPPADVPYQRDEPADPDATTVLPVLKEEPRGPRRDVPWDPTGIDSPTEYIIMPGPMAGEGPAGPTPAFDRLMPSGWRPEPGDDRGRGWQQPRQYRPPMPPAPGPYLPPGIDSATEIIPILGPDGRPLGRRPAPAKPGQEPAADTGEPSLARSSRIMAIATAASRLTGFARSAAITAAIGLSVVGDAYNTANTLPNIVYELLLGGVLTSVVVPLLVHAQEEDKDGGLAYTQRLMSLATAAVGVATVLAVLGAPLLTALYAGSGDSAHLTTVFAWLLLPEIFFYGLGAMFGAVLNTRGVYGPPAWAPVLNNLVVIATAILFLAAPGPRVPDEHTITTAQVLVLGIGTTAGIILQAFILLPALRRAGFRWKWRLDVRGSRLGEAGALAGWVLGYVAVSQVGYVVVTRLANSVHKGEGAGYAVFTNASLLFQMPYGILGVSLLTALMPRMSRAAARGDRAGMVADLALGSRLTALTLVPVTAAFVVLGPAIGTLVFGHGAALESDAHAVGVVLAASSFGLVPFAVTMLQLRVFYAIKDSRTPTLINVGMVIAKVVLSLLLAVVLSKQHLVIGLAVATSVSYVVGAIVGEVLLRRRFGALGTSKVIRTTVRLTVLSVFGGLAAWGTQAVVTRWLGHGLAGSAGAIVLGSIAGLVTLAVIASQWQVAEFRELLGSLRSRGGSPAGREPAAVGAGGPGAGGGPGGPGGPGAGGPGAGGPGAGGPGAGGPGAGGPGAGGPGAGGPGPGPGGGPARPGDPGRTPPRPGPGRPGQRPPLPPIPPGYVSDHTERIPPIRPDLPYPPDRQGYPQRPRPDRPDPGRPDPGRPDPGRPDPGRPDPGRERPDPGQRHQPPDRRPDAGYPDPGQRQQPPAEHPDPHRRPDGGYPDPGQRRMREQPAPERPDGRRPDGGYPDRRPPPDPRPYPPDRPHRDDPTRIDPAQGYPGRPDPDQGDDPDGWRPGRHRR